MYFYSCKVINFTLIVSEHYLFNVCILIFIYFNKCDKVRKPVQAFENQTFLPRSNSCIFQITQKLTEYSDVKNLDSELINYVTDSSLLFLFIFQLHALDIICCVTSKNHMQS